MTPQGKFVMTCLGQGYHNSGDHLNINTHCLLAGIQKSIEIIDDGLLQQETAIQAYKEAWKVIMVAMKGNFKFSGEKFVIGLNAKFAGLDLTANPVGNVTIKPDRKCI